MLVPFGWLLSTGFDVSSSLFFSFFFFIPTGMGSRISNQGDNRLLLLLLLPTFLATRKGSDFSFLPIIIILCCVCIYIIYIYLLLLERERKRRIGHFFPPHTHAQHIYSLSNGFGWGPAIVSVVVPSIGGDVCPTLSVFCFFFFLLPQSNFS